MNYNQLSIITTVLLLSLLAPLTQSQTPPNPKYLGPTDAGVSYYPQFEGLKMHIRCYTEPSVINGKTMIFDSGLPWFSSAFAKVIELLIPKMSTYGLSKACFYDRYGMGFSDSNPSGSVQGFDLARKLKNSLSIMGLCPPYIYAGWSWGGIDAQFFSLLYPNQVQGLLLIESSDRFLSTDYVYQSYIPGFLSEINNFISLNSNGTLRDEGINGDIPELFGYPSYDSPLPANALNITQEIFLAPSNKYLTASYQEVNSMVSTSTLLDAAYNSSSNPAHPLGNIPLVVLYSSSGDSAWIARQQIVKNLTTNSEIYGVNSSHMVPFEAAQTLVDRIQNLITRINNTPVIHTFTCINIPIATTTTGPSITITTTGSSSIISSSSGTVSTTSSSSISTGTGFSHTTTSSSITTTGQSTSSTSSTSSSTSTSTTG